MKYALLLLLTSLAIYGQPSPEPLNYEVASIKPTNDGDLGYTFRIEPDGTLAAAGITLKRLMMTAYNVQGFRIVGGPDWVASKRWTVQAKPSRAAASQQIREILRTLLEDRFQLRSHSERRKMLVYELSIDRRGPKVPRVKVSETEPVVRVTNGSIRLTKAQTATFASQLSYAVGRPVVDKTGLSGEFDFVLEWTPVPGEDGGPTNSGLPPGTPEQPASTPDGPSIFSAIPEQLGLRLKSRRGPVDVVVIDHVQMPMAN